MHILMISLDFLPTVGGITAHVYELSRALMANGSKVSVITRRLPDTSKEENIDGIDVYRVDLKYFGFTYGWQINSFIKAKLFHIKPDLIHIHGMRPLEFYDIKKIPLVYTNHTSGYLKRILKGGYRIHLLKRVFKKPDLFLAPSEELLQIPFEIRAKKIYIPNGVIMQKYQRKEDIRKKVREDLDISENEILGIVTRRMVWKNGVLDLAFATQYIKNKKLKLLFIGDGEDFEKVKIELEKNFRGRFLLLGAKKHNEIIEYYSASDFSILPSLMEATSISGLEAMAASLALVGTNVGGIPDLIEDGENGFLCEPSNPEDLANKIDKLLDLDFVEMGQISLKKVATNFDWDLIAKRTMKAYKEIL